MEAMPTWERRFRGTTPSFPTLVATRPRSARLLVEPGRRLPGLHVRARRPGRPGASPPSRSASRTGCPPPTAPRRSGSRTRPATSRDAGSARRSRAAARSRCSTSSRAGRPGSPWACGRSRWDVRIATGYSIHVSVDGGPTRELYHHTEAASIGGTVGEIERTGFNLGGLSADERLRLHRALRARRRGPQGAARLRRGHRRGRRRAVGRRGVGTARRRLVAGRPATSAWRSPTSGRIAAVRPSGTWPPACGPTSRSTCPVTCCRWIGGPTHRRSSSRTSSRAATSCTASSSPAGALERIQHEPGTRARGAGATRRRRVDAAVERRQPAARGLGADRRGGRAAPRRPTPGVPFESWHFDNRDGVSDPRVRGGAAGRRAVPDDHAGARRSDVADARTTGSPRSRPTWTTASRSGS